MIDVITDGDDITGLLYYLWGPGKANEHTNPHLIAGFRHPLALEPAVTDHGRRDFRHLTATLNHPLDTLRGASFAKPVWQCSLRNAPTDRILTDQEWATIAEEVMHQAGIAPRGDPDGCRWIAVRHADDHIHLAAVLAREDGRRPRLYRDKKKVRAACIDLERRYGLRSTAPTDRTAAPRPSRKETEAAARTGRAEPPRPTIRRLVATAAAGSESAEEFFARLEDFGLVHSERYSSRDPAQITGYTVGLPGHTTSTGEQYMFRGSSLAPDLSYTKLATRWRNAPYGPDRASSADRTGSRIAGPLTRTERNAIYHQAATIATQAARQFQWSGDPRQRADIAAATADTLRWAAYLTGNPHLRKAADSYDRAAREPYGRTPQPSPFGHALRNVARALAVAAGPTARRVHDTITTIIELVGDLINLVERVADYRAAQGRPAQAEAARTAADHLRDATQRGQALPNPDLAYDLAATAFPMSIDQSVQLPGHALAGQDTYGGRGRPTRSAGPRR